MTDSRFAKTGFLTRFSFRRDWLRLIIWIIVLASLMAAVAAKFETIYGTSKEIQSIAATLKSPGVVSLFGAFTLKGHITSAQIFANEMLVFMGMIQVVMSIGLAVHATRTEEDLGITEMVRSHAVGRLAPLSAAATEITLVNVIIGILYGFGLQLANMPGADTTGNWLISLGLASVGLTFGMMTLLCAQLADHAAAASGMAYAVFGLTFITRMITDLKNPDATWWSPMGWIEKLSPYIHNNWFPIGAYLLLSVGLFLLAGWANLHRDLGAGVLATREGHATASALLRGPLSLLLRLEHNVMLAWIVGIAILGASYGSVFNSIGDILKTNPTMQTVFGKAAVHSANHAILLNYTALLVLVLISVSAIPAIQLMTKLRGDETRGWLESIYAKPVTRTKQFVSYLGVATVTGIVTYGAGLGSLIGLGNSTLKTSSEGLSTFEFWQTFWGQFPSLLIFLGLAAVLVGWLPRLLSLNWAYLAFSFVVMYMGNLLKFPHWVKNWTPLGWMSKVPVHHVDWPVFWWMLALAAVLMVIGWIGYRRRDLQVN